MNLIWFLCWFSDSIIDGFAREVLAFAELVGCFNAVISADIAFNYTADSSVSFTIIFFDAFPTDYSLVITVNLPKR